MSHLIHLYLYFKISSITISNFISELETRGILIQIIRLLYVLNKIELAIKLYKDETLSTFLNGTYASLLIMNKLLLEGRLKDTIDLFFSQLNYYSTEKSYSIDANLAFRQTIPYDHLDLVVEALYIQVNNLTLMFI